MFYNYQEDTETTVYVRKRCTKFQRKINNAVYLQDKMTGYELNDIIQAAE